MYGSMIHFLKKVVWVTRREGEPYVVQEGDPLPQRERLYKLGNSLAASGEVISSDIEGYYSGKRAGKTRIFIF